MLYDYVLMAIMCALVLIITLVGEIRICKLEEKNKELKTAIKSLEDKRNDLLSILGSKRMWSNTELIILDGKVYRIAGHSIHHNTYSCDSLTVSANYVYKVPTTEEDN